MKIILAVLSVCLFCGACASLSTSPDAKRAAVVLSPQLKGEWESVANALVEKYRARGFLVLEVKGTSEEKYGEALKSFKPHYVAFVRTPNEVDFKTVVKLHREMRLINDGPFEDAIWGIVTGPTVTDALRVARADKMDLSRALSTTGVPAEKFTDVVMLMDHDNSGSYQMKYNGGEIVTATDTGDLTHIFADAWRDIDPGVIITSSHASERNLEMPYSRGNVIVKEDALWTCPNAVLIDYRTGQAKEGPATGFQPLATAKNEKIWIAPGNCLIANRIDERSMVMAAMGFGKCNQFFGYVLTTWYGAAGWGTYHSWLNENTTLGEAFFKTQNEIIEKINAICSNADTFAPTPTTSREYEAIFRSSLSEFVKDKAIFVNPEKKVEQMRDLMGLLWDREATVLYGDPALETKLPKIEK